MKVKANVRIETIFAHAAAMDSRGLRNTIHCVGSNIYIVNADHSMILRFPLRREEIQFDEPVSINAADYESASFEVKDGKVIFHTQGKGYLRRKICSANREYDINDLRRLYHRYIHAETSFSFDLSRDVCSLLDERLSHIEIAAENGQLILRQRDIYAGSLIEVQKVEAGLLEGAAEILPERFGPVGLKTVDFMAAFVACEQLRFLPTEDYTIIQEPRGFMDGLIAFCKYDEIIQLYTEAGGE